MSLENEIRIARKQIVTDGYEMSFGELMSLYKENELIINPDFQRYFRWDDIQKTRFIESLLLGIPIPPIFVFQTLDGTWELVDGLQRLSTVFELVGILKDKDGKLKPNSTLRGTKQLPCLNGKRWVSTNNDNKNILSKSQQLDIKRARIRVEILKKGSDPLGKYELFQRLNTGGSILSEQEVRNCIMVMLNKEFSIWINDLSKFEAFNDTIVLTKNAQMKQQDVELALRFFVYRNVKYNPGLDIHEYLDNAMIEIASSSGFSIKQEEQIFKTTFSFLDKAMGKDSFKRWNGSQFQGKFIMSAYEVIATGISFNLDSLSELNIDERNNFLKGGFKFQVQQVN